jgi:glycosyltransferase involved in cell wall biosynthesis
LIGPRVSIIVPCFNAAAYLEYALLGISRQTYKNFEIILVNDGSTDATAEIVRKSERFLPIVHVDLGSNHGLAHALNAGLAKAKGEFIARFDADDFMLDFRLNDQVNFLLENTDIDLVGGGATLFGLMNGEHRQKCEHDEILSEFLLNNPFVHPTVMFKRKLYDEGLYHYRPDYPNEEDYELWSRLLPRIKAANLHYPVIKYRIHNNNAQRNPGKKAIKTEAINNFLLAYGYSDTVLVKALAEYQCSGYMSREGYERAREYVSLAGSKGLPRLGRLHSWIASEGSYRLFMEYS